MNGVINSLARVHHYPLCKSVFCNQATSCPKMALIFKQEVKQVGFPKHLSGTISSNQMIVVNCPAINAQRCPRCTHVSLRVFVFKVSRNCCVRIIILSPLTLVRVCVWHAHSHASSERSKPQQQPPASHNNNLSMKSAATGLWRARARAIFIIFLLSRVLTAGRAVGLLWAGVSEYLLL